MALKPDFMDSGNVQPDDRWDSVRTVRVHASFAERFTGGHMNPLRLNKAHDTPKQVSIPKVAKLMALSGAALLLGSCGLLANVGGGGPVLMGTVSAATGTAVPAASEYRMALVRYSIFGPGASELEAAEFLTPFTLSGGAGAFTGSLPASVDVGSGNTRAYYRVIVFDDVVDDNKYDRNATNGAGAKDRLLADSANGKGEGGNRYLIYANDNQDYVAGKPLSKGWNHAEHQRCQHHVLNLGDTSGNQLSSTSMPQGDKSAYTDKQKRQAKHVEETYLEQGLPESRAEQIAWSTVNKQDGGGNRSGSGRSEAAKRGWETRRKRDTGSRS
jgi:hypothetical protein